MRILLVEDDESIIDVLETVLTEQNYVVDVATDGDSGWELVEACPYDLVLLDLVLPKLDGISFCRRLREQKNPVLVMLLTARDTTTDKLLGLDAGADDYVVKPFDVQELTARMRALLRRGTAATSPILSCGLLQLDPSACEVTYQGKPLRFSRKEYLLLELFLRHQHRVFSRSVIVDQIWSFSEDPPNEDTVKSHIKSIRRKLDAVGAGDMIETLYGQGYRINPSYLAKAAESPLTGSPEKQQQVDSAVSRVWQRTRGMSLKRVAFLEQVVQALKTTSLTSEWWILAGQNAHKLAGSLGTFGFEHGSRLARQIETLLDRDAALTLTASVQEQLARQLEPLVLALQQELTEPTQSNTSPITSAPSASPAVASPSPAVAQRKVLAVDDDPQISLILKGVLEPQGIQLTCLEDPNRFWETLDGVQPDLLILDINMPGVNGVDLCQTVRHDAEWNWLPIVFLTAQMDPQTQEQVFVAGADDYITKPIVPTELTTRVCNRLQRSHTLSSRGQRGFDAEIG
ncbi:MAG: response regulator [Synechococcales cyanobacterium C42_A2020_086]|jgi:DNA-binding response OmpR family regulator|nr:response regulator [Synechococcales cyanobacterium C42_A2020_086]